MHEGVRDVADPAGSHDPDGFGSDLVGIRHVLHHEFAHDRIKGSVLEGQMGGIGDDIGPRKAEEIHVHRRRRQMFAHPRAEVTDEVRLLQKMGGRRQDTSSLIRRFRG